MSLNHNLGNKIINLLHPEHSGIWKVKIYGHSEIIENKIKKVCVGQDAAKRFAIESIKPILTFDSLKEFIHDSCVVPRIRSNDNRKLMSLNENYLKYMNDEVVSFEEIDRLIYEYLEEIISKEFRTINSASWGINAIPYIDFPTHKWIMINFEKIDVYY